MNISETPSGETMVIDIPYDSELKQKSRYSSQTPVVVEMSKMNLQTINEDGIPGVYMGMKYNPHIIPTSVVSTCVGSTTSTNANPIHSNTIHTHYMYPNSSSSGSSSSSSSSFLNSTIQMQPSYTSYPSHSSHPLATNNLHTNFLPDARDNREVINIRGDSKEKEKEKEKEIKESRELKEFKEVKEVNHHKKIRDSPHTIRSLIRCSSLPTDSSGTPSYLPLDKDASSITHGNVMINHSNTIIPTTNEIYWTDQIEQAFDDFIELLKQEKNEMRRTAFWKKRFGNWLLGLSMATSALLVFESIFASLSANTVVIIRSIFGAVSFFSTLSYKIHNFPSESLRCLEASHKLDRMIQDSRFELMKPRNQRRHPHLFFTQLEDQRDKIKHKELESFIPYYPPQQQPQPQPQPQPQLQIIQPQLQPQSFSPSPSPPPPPPSQLQQQPFETNTM